MAEFEAKGDDTAERFAGELAKAMQDAMRETLMRAAQYQTGVIRKVVQRVYPRGKGGLARSFRERFLKLGAGKFAVQSYSSLVYAGIQNRGGTIRPRVRKHLAIPLPGSGVPMGKWPRHFGDELFPFRSKRGNLLLGIRQGDGVKPLFVLKKSVRITGTGYLDIAQQEAADGVAKIAGDELRSSVAKASAEAR